MTVVPSNSDKWSLVKEKKTHESGFGKAMYDESQNADRRSITLRAWGGDKLNSLWSTGPVQFVTKCCQKRNMNQERVHEWSQNRESLPALTGVPSHSGQAGVGTVAAPEQKDTSRPADTCRHSQGAHLTRQVKT